MVKCPVGCIPDPNYKKRKHDDGDRPSSAWLSKGADGHLPWPPKNKAELLLHLQVPGYAKSHGGPRSDNTVNSYATGIFNVWKGKYGGSPDALAWDWLKKTRANIAFVEADKRGLSSKRQMLSGMQAAAKIMRMDEEAEAYGKVASTIGHAIDTLAEENVMNESDKAKFKTPMEFDKNVMILEAAANKLGTQGAGGTKLREEEYNRVWMTYMAYKTLVQTTDAVHRLQSVYSTQVLDHIPRRSEMERLRKDKTNYFAYNPSKPKEPILLVLNSYKTVTAHGPAMYSFEEPSFIKGFHDSMKAYPRKWFISLLRNPDEPLGNARASSFIKEGFVLRVAEGEQKPTANTIRHVFANLQLAENRDYKSRDQFAKRSLTSKDTLERHYQETEITALLVKEEKQRAKIIMTREMREVVDEIVAGTYSWSSEVTEGQVSKSKRMRTIDRAGK